MASSPFNTLGQQLRASYNQYKAYCNLRRTRRHVVIDIFFNEMIRPNVKKVLIQNAKEGRSWGYVYTYPKNLYVVLKQEFGKKSSIEYSEHWVKDAYHIFELIHDNRFVQMMTEIEEELSDTYTAIRMYRTENIDNEEKYNGIWVEWTNINVYEA